MSTHAPLFLLQGLNMSADARADAIPLPADQHEVIAPTAVGHHGGAPPIGRLHPHLDSVGATPPSPQVPPLQPRRMS